MFEGQYNDLFLAVDVIAERIRALGEKAPGTFKAYQEIAEISEGNENATATEMVKQLADDQEIILKIAKGVFAAAQETGDEVSTDLAIQRMTAHEKNEWILKSSL